MGGEEGRTGIIIIIFLPVVAMVLDLWGLMHQLDMVYIQIILGKEGDGRSGLCLFCCAGLVLLCQYMYCYVLNNKIKVEIKKKKKRGTSAHWALCFLHFASWARPFH